MSSKGGKGRSSVPTDEREKITSFFSSNQPSRPSSNDTGRDRRAPGIAARDSNRKRKRGAETDPASIFGPSVGKKPPSNRPPPSAAASMKSRLVFQFTLPPQSHAVCHARPFRH